MDLDWTSIAEFKNSGFKVGWKFKHLCSFIQCGTLDYNVSRNPGVYMVIRNCSSATEFVENGTANLSRIVSERSNQQIEEKMDG